MGIWLRAVKAVVSSNLSDLFSDLDGQVRDQDPRRPFFLRVGRRTTDGLGMGTYDGAANTPAVRASGNSMAHQSESHGRYDEPRPRQVGTGHVKRIASVARLPWRN